VIGVTLCGFLQEFVYLLCRAIYFRATENHDENTERFLMEKIEKNQDEKQEFYIPHQGLDLDYYLNIELTENPTAQEVRLKKQAIHHLSRYYWAVEVLENCPRGRLLDIACGAGYGTYLLAKALPNVEVVGGDYDRRSIDYAQKTFGKLPNLTYEKMDLVSWEKEDGASIGKFDIVVSFDTIEHLHFREIALINISENLVGDSVLLFSTPCGHRKNKLNPEWEHHKIEYSYIYLVNLMKRFFSDVRIPDDGSLPMISFWKEKVNKDTVLYLNRANPMFCSKPIKHGS
jgi:2-polyprenyl-3-methyl-5-hydroxy-6-metoxy-1,4-benzoquinol methylase